MLTKAQQLMVADGMPAELLLATEQRAAWWAANPPRTRQVNNQPELREQPKARERAAIRKVQPIPKGKRWDPGINQWMPINMESRMQYDDTKSDPGDKATAGDDQPSQVAAIEDNVMTATETNTKATAKRAKTPAVKKASAKKANGKAKVAKKANGKAKVAKARTPRDGNKTQEILAKLRTAKGITRADILEMTGWQAVSVQQLVRAQGLNPDKDLKVSDERPFTYRLTK